VLRQRLAAVWAEGDVLRTLRQRQTLAAAGRARGPEPSVRKALADAHGQHLMNLGRDLAGPFGMLAGTGPTRTTDSEWSQGFLYSPALTIGGGTAEVQRNIVAEQVLGLPRDSIPT
jgi:alkylation response protein AidB-like acyl-CoA dehydrogenase